METTEPDDFGISHSEALKHLLPADELASMQANLADLGEPSQERTDEPLQLASSPEKPSPALKVPFPKLGASGATVAVSGEPKQLTIADLISDTNKTKRGRKPKSTQLRKRSPVVSKKEFLEDKGPVSLEKMLDGVVKEGSSSPKRNRRVPKKQSSKWNKEETERFYEVISMVGLDFSLIERFFKNRSRKQLLSKYRKEKKTNPERIDSIFVKTGAEKKIWQGKCKDFLKKVDSKDLPGMESRGIVRINSVDSLETTIKKSLHNVLENTHDMIEYANTDEIKPLQYYLNRIDHGFVKEEDAPERAPETKLEAEGGSNSSSAKKVKREDSNGEEEEETTATDNGTQAPSESKIPDEPSEKKQPKRFVSLMKRAASTPIGHLGSAAGSGR